MGPSPRFWLVRRLRLVREHVAFDARADGADQGLGGKLQNGAPAGFELAPGSVRLVPDSVAESGHYCENKNEARRFTERQASSRCAN